MSEGEAVLDADVPSQAAQSRSAQPPVPFGAGLPSPPPARVMTSSQAAVTPASQNQNVLGSCYFFFFFWHRAFEGKQIQEPEMFPSLWVTTLLPSAKEAIKFHLNPGESQASAGGRPRRLPARQLPRSRLPGTGTGASR